MNKMSRFFDTVLSFLVIFAIGFTACARLTLRAIPSLLTGLVLALCLCPLYLKLTRKEGKTKNNDEVRRALILMGEKNLLSLIHSLLKRDATLKEGFIEVDGGKIFCSFTKAPLSLDKTVSICSNANCEKVLIITNSFDSDCTCATVCGVKVTLWDFEKVYDFLQKRNALPSPLPKEKRNKLNEFFAKLLSKENAKGYFKSALIIFALSGFVGASVYYIIFASLSLVLGITVLVLPRKKT